MQCCASTGYIVGIAHGASTIRYFSTGHGVEAASTIRSYRPGVAREHHTLRQYRTSLRITRLMNGAVLYSISGQICTAFCGRLVRRFAVD
eukprot:3142703-Rhodomonas_salina.2